ncbi:sigma-54-dependent Fis family transcriptional regulator [bacterium]|nr:sigma-54-dependent Fis family transcriptional regulator [bacterium]
MTRPSVLIVDDSADDIELLETALVDSYDTIAVRTCADGIKKLDELIPDIILLDLRFPGGEDGLSALREIKRREPGIPVIMVTESTETSDAVECVKGGAFHFVEKQSLRAAVLLSLMEKAIEQRRGQRAAASARTEAHDAYGDIIGTSPPMLQMLSEIEEVAPTDAAVLVLGETGTGKELVARRIHELSRRRRRQLVTVACPAIAANLMESEFFGVSKGAFTGAVPKEGRFELAHGGTIFLDEVGDIELPLQPKLLRALEDGTFERVGDRATIRVDVRVISATSRDLDAMAKAGGFRSELLYRLNTYPIRVPPLRERREDIRPLVEHFVNRFASRMDKQVEGVAPGVIEQLQKHDWSDNNVRELRNCVEAAMIRCKGKVITWSDFRVGGESDLVEAGAYMKSREEFLSRFERAYLEQVFRMFKGNVSRAAEHAGLSRQTLHSMAKRTGVDPGAFRQA